MFKGPKISLAVAAVALAISSQSFAMGGPTGAHTSYPVFGQIGGVVVNPYEIAPQTAVIENGGYVLKNATVRIVPKEGGQEIKYRVSDDQLLTHGGIPVFGLYSGYVNTVEVSYTRIQNGKTKKDVKESYRIFIPAVGKKTGMAMPPQMKAPMDASNNYGFVGPRVKKVEKEFKDRLYFFNLNNQQRTSNAKMSWNNPAGGALEWDYEPNHVGIIDTQGELRWSLNVTKEMYQPGNMWQMGNMMGFRQNDDGAISWGFGQRYVKYDIFGRQVFDRTLPRNYIDFSHDMEPASNGNFFMRVAAANYKRADNRNVRTVRDVIAEVDPNGVVREEWRMAEILDPYRDVNIKALDQGAVCLNLDASKSGHTLAAEDLQAADKGDNFGDVTGVGPGRNWAHINSVNYDKADDSIILSVRHQSAVVKVGRDKKVKWILASPEGWNKELSGKVLTPVDKNGKKIKCEGSKCEGDFDWTWTQHSAYKVVEKSKGNIIYITVFDNGDSRGMEQPAIPTMKYSRAVVYKIDQKKMTVEQTWEYGKERGYEWYSPITSLAKYQADKNSVMVFSATAGGFAGPKPMRPVLNEFKWGAKEPSVEIQFAPAGTNIGYRAFPFDLKKAVNQ